MNEANRSEETLFEMLSQAPASERAAQLDKVCGADAALRQRLELLLAAHDRAGEFMAKPAAPVLPQNEGLPIPVAERLGDQIGHYKLLQQIGEGGCGVVYMAQQEEPVRRLVALKVIKLGMDTRQVVARFEAERQALALMDHPNIAKVLDAGATETGRPYFVMELVRGLKITQYCDQHRLATRERLELFTQVCRAIQHAHQKGVIHRDIKPSNILVTTADGVAVPKVIDFGIAKATQGRLTDQTLVTGFEQFLGTPAYVSPEQALMTNQDIDTRSDIYSLGVLLYELLTGKTPFDTRQLLAAGLEAMRRTICQTPPARPSTRLNAMEETDLTTVAWARQAEPGKLTSLLRGDLDWIVMKCLEKDRARRYETANGLARDVERHLSNEPVTARPPSRLYQFQKSARRHWVGFAATAAVIAALAIGLLVSALEAVRARKAEREQSRERIVAQQAQASEAKQKVAAQQALYDSLLGQARATRLARRLGYRDRVFGILEQAKALNVPGKNPADLRNEAVACLGDFVGLTPATFTHFATNLSGLACLAPSGKVAAFGLSDGTIELLEMPSGKEVARLDGPGTNGLFAYVCFNATGNKLFATCSPTNTQSFQLCLSRTRLYSWSRNADGLWQATGNGLLPGAVDLFPNGREVFAVDMEVDSLNPADPESRCCLKFRLLNITTECLVAGCAVTNTVPAQFDYWFDETPDGRLFAVQTWDPRVPNPSPVLKLYDWKTGRRLNQLRLPMAANLSLSPDGKYLAWLSKAGGAIYTVPGLERLVSFKEYFAGFHGNPAVFSHSMAALFLFQQNQVRLWNLRSGEDIAMLDQAGVPKAFASDGNSLLTVGADRARLYRLKTAEKLDLPSHAAAVPAVAFSPSGTRLASVGKDRVIRVYDAMTGRVLWETNDLPGLGQCVSYSPDGEFLASGVSSADQMWIWDARTGNRMLELGTKEAGSIFSAEFSPDGRYLATAGGNGVRIYKIEHAGAIGGPGGLKVKPFKLFSVPGTPGMTESLRFSPDSRFFSFWGNFGVPHFYLWDFRQQAKPDPIALHHYLHLNVACEGFTPDGHLVVLDTSGRIVTFEVPGGREVASLQAESSPLGQLISLSQDGSRVAVTSASRLGVEVWDFKARKRLYLLPDESGTVYWLAWSPDSRRLAVARENGNIAIWDLDAIHQILAQLGLEP